jgi:glucan 1,4-alpha-glucosidase
MRLTTALNEYKRQHGQRFPEELRTVEGIFSGHGDRLVHVSPDGDLRDYSAPLSGLNGIDRSRLGIETPDRTYWLQDLQVIRQHYYGETRLVETEFDADGFTVHQFDLTLGRAHVTHVELRGVVPTGTRLVAFLTIAPEGREGSVGALIHEEAGPDETQAVEVYHRKEHDYVTASTGLADVRGQRPEEFAEILDADPVEFPRGGVEPYDETRLSGNFVVTAPLEREGRGARTTLVTQLSNHDEIDRETALSDLRACATEFESAESLRTAAREQPTVEVSADLPRADQLRADLRVVDLLRGAAGGHIAGPEFDPFYANSGGYGYVWFRDDANVASRLLDAGDRLGLDVDETLVTAARFYCDTQLDDGTWPHRVWATDGTLAPGWANAKVERKAASSEYQADQTATVTAFLATLLDREDGSLPPGLGEEVRETVALAVEALDASLAANGLPTRCQNAWENAVGQFTHTAATFLEAYAKVAAAPVPDALAASAEESAKTVVDGLSQLWDADRECYGMRLVDGEFDDRLDAASLALVEAMWAWDRVDAADVDGDRIDRLGSHMDAVWRALFRDPDGSVAGVVRYEGDRWRTVDQPEPKVWSVTTGWWAVAAARFAELTAGDTAERHLDRAKRAYRLLSEDGPFVTDGGYLAEQVFDDGTPDSATPLGWSHVLRLHATALLDGLDALPVTESAPTAPPERPRWTSGEKYGLSTAADHSSADPSRVWFTLTEGALTEARFPRIDVMNMRTLDFLVRCRDDDYTVRTHTERGNRTDSVSREVVPIGTDSLLYRHVFSETERNGFDWTLTVEYVPDPAHDAIVADVRFEAEDDKEYDVFAVADVALANTGNEDRGLRVGDDGAYNLLAREPTDYTTETAEPLLVDENGEGYSVATAMTASGRFDWATVGVAGSEHLDAIFGGDPLPEPQTAVDNESLVLVGRLGTGASVSETVAAGFARRANTAAALGEANGSLERGFETVLEAYRHTWATAMEGTPIPSAVSEERMEAQYRTSLMSLLAVEDKTYHGASIASPSVPWGQAVSAEEPKGYGYNFVWSRDLYQVFTAFLAAGFEDIAVTQLEYIYEYQQDDEGFIPQNTYVNGITRWGGEQMDNISFPQVMAYHLWRAGIDFESVGYGYEHVRRSADYVTRNGPTTVQERWEEEAGYSPSSIATEIAGLACAGKLAIETGERADALIWLALADEWATSVEAWTATETGTDRHTETPYYVRVTRDGEPEAGHVRTLANAGPTLDERDIIDAGFLELVRLGIKPADDAIIDNSVTEVDRTIRVEFDAGPGFYRYNGDGYGERATGDKGGPWSTEEFGRGRIWPLLTGERGEYQLLRDGDGLTAETCLDTMGRFANSGRMIAEQVWDRRHGTEYGWKFGTGTGSATPLAWSMAQFVRLAHSIDAGKPIERPAFVEDRYLDRRRQDAGEDLDLTVDAHFRGDQLVVSGTSTGELVAIKTPVDATVIEPTDGTFEVAMDVQTSHNEVTVAAADRTDLAKAATTVRRLSL